MKTTTVHEIRCMCRHAAVGVVLGLMNASVCGQMGAFSNFDTDPQGWTFDRAAAWRPANGNPGGCLQNIEEPTNGPAWAIASPAFLGNWSTLDGRGLITFDHRRVSNGGGDVIMFLPIIIELTGPAGTAQWQSQLLPTPGDWQTFYVPIQESAWSVNPGQSWTAILANVQTLRFFLEQVSNTATPEDLNLLDNVSLTLNCDPLDFNGDGVFPDSGDIADFLAVFSGGVCAGQSPTDPPCNSDIDFNNDGVSPDSDDIATLIRVFGGGTC